MKDYCCFVVAIILCALFSTTGVAYSQGNDSDNGAVANVIFVPLEDLQRENPDSIVQLREAGMTDARIRSAIHAAQSVAPYSTPNGTATTQSSGLEYWYCECQFEQTANITGIHGPPILHTTHEFNDGTLSNTATHHCPSALGCFFWSRAWKQGAWTYRFYLYGHSWLTRLGQWCS